MTFAKKTRKLRVLNFLFFKKIFHEKSVEKKTHHRKKSMTDKELPKTPKSNKEDFDKKRLIYSNPPVQRRTNSTNYARPKSTIEDLELARMRISSHPEGKKYVVSRKNT